MLSDLFFRNPVTGVMEGIILLHNTIMFYLIVVLVLVSWMLYVIVKDFGFNMYFGLNNPESVLKSRRETLVTGGVVHGSVIEIVWTIVPSLVLVCIAIPSFALLYTMDELYEPTLTLKVIGHQWYWSYEYSDFEETLAFDSYMVTEDDLEEGQLRLLEVDRKVWLPVDTHVRVIVTASDVLHCWAVPAMGVKMDAVPGRLNQTTLFAQRPGVFYGQCSEICGVNHGFMPISVKVVPVDLFNYWVDLNL